MPMAHWFPRFRARLRVSFRGRRLERELDAELRFHLDQQVAEHLGQGMSPKEAARAAGTDREHRLHRRAGGTARESPHARHCGLPPAR